MCGPGGQHLEPKLGDDAVLAQQRHDVGQRADGRDLDERGSQLARPVRAHSACTSFSATPTPARFLSGYAQSWRFGLITASASGSSRVRLVVVGDDQIEAERARVPRRVGRADAAVHRDDQDDAVGVQPIERGRLQPVAVAQALGDEVDDVGAEQLERAAQDHGRRDAVHVVVAVDGDALLARDRAENALDGHRHVGQRERVVQVVERRRQEPARQVDVAEPADAQQARGDGRDPELAGEQPGPGVVARLGLPDAADHDVCGSRFLVLPAHFVFMFGGQIRHVCAVNAGFNATR